MAYNEEESLNGDSKHTQEQITPSEKTKDEHTTTETTGLLYRINEMPPMHIAVFLAIQHLVLCFASTLTLSIVIGDTLCSGPHSVLRSQLFNTALCMSGLNTLAQSLVGSRLPMFQGPSFTFIAPLIALGSDPSWSCDSDVTTPQSDLYATRADASDPTGPEKISAIEKLQQMSGSLIAASMVEVVIGAVGLVGPIMRRVGPVTVAPTIMLIGLSLYKLPIQYSRPCPPMAIASTALVLVFSLYLQRFSIPIGCGENRPTFPIFQVLPVLLSIAVVWTVAAILTSCGVFPDDPESLAYLARTDAKAGLVHATPWILFTYPGQFGIPSFNLAAFVGFTAAVLSSVVESVCDYITAARSCAVPPPPQHAVSRGLLLEGLGSVLSGVYGAGHATATYSSNIALLRLCRSGSRSVLVMAGVILVAVSFVGKIAAAASTVPEPILGGVFLVILGMLVSIGMAPIRHVDMQSTRNLIILGVSLFVGMVIPGWLEAYPGALDTGSRDADQVIRVLLGTPMIVGGAVACFLDNTVQGTATERGLHEWAYGNETEKVKDKMAELDDVIPIFSAHPEEDIYSWSWYPKLLQKYPLLRYVPFLPPMTQSGGQDA